MALQNGNTINFLKGFIIFEGTIKCLSGLHIKGATETIEIGGIDSYLIRNPLTNEPYIPGSSIKGKLRSIVEKIVKKDNSYLKANRCSDTKNKIWRHECDSFEDAKNCPLCRVFGSTGKNNDNDNYPSKLIVYDSMLKDKESLMKDGLYITEAKMENTLDRLTSAATPRTIERIPEGTIFNFKMIYKKEIHSLDGNIIEDNNNNIIINDNNIINNNINNNDLIEDFKNISIALSILEKDGLGGNISRGYGRIKFNITCKEIGIDGNQDDIIITKDIEN